jgi:GTP cyclohydrolase I
MPADYNDAVQAAEILLQYLVGEDDIPDAHTDRTAERMVSGLSELTQKEEFDFTVFPSDVDEMVVMQNIDFVTLCAHHVLPFHGRAHVAYIPQGQVVGLSKLARTVRYFSKGLNIQEELTQMIQEYLYDKLSPLGVAVVMEAEHMCMTIRGIQAAGTITTTASMVGVFRDDDNNARSEFYSIIRRP